MHCNDTTSFGAWERGSEYISTHKVTLSFVFGEGGYPLGPIYYIGGRILVVGFLI